MNKVEIHKSICDKFNETYIAKNSDYGDSFARVRKEEGEASILVRLKDKLYRLESLLHGNASKVTDESIEDTLLDLGNYCIMELVERKVDRERLPICHGDKGYTATPLEESAMNVGEAISTLIAKDHAEHYWQNRG